MYKVIKIVLDVTLAFVLLTLLFPVIIILTILLSLTSTPNPFFIQRRPGKDGQVFKLYKFRTMNNKRDENGKLLPDQDRLTPMGRFVRSTSLDELPQLFNVLRGDMSFVGPRPLLIKYLDRYTPEQMRRHEVKPGITGWAQVNGRNAISWERKFELDVYYVDNQSFALDLRIIFITLQKVVQRHGITSAGEATAQEFLGKSESK